MFYDEGFGCGVVLLAPAALRVKVLQRQLSSGSGGERRKRKRGVWRKESIQRNQIQKLKV